MNGSWHGRRGRFLATTAAVLLAVSGIVAIGVGYAAQQSPPSPPASAANPPSASATSTPGTPSSPGKSGATGRPAPATRGPLLSRSTPVRLDIPALGAHSDLLQLGLNADRTVQVPPLGRDSKAGWYKYSPTPGQLGPSIILGHIDSAKYGPGIFFKLGALRPGNTVSVTRADRKVAVFRVDRVVEYPKAHFPTLDVYGNTDHAALRLITCGGKFDPSKRSYEDNIVAYASLVSVH